MDGTLMGNDSCVSAVASCMLNDLIEQHGTLFTVATARTPATVVPLMSQVHCTLPFIVMSGAALWNAATASFEQVQVIPPDVVDATCRIAHKHALHPFIYRRHGNLLHAYHSTSLSPQEQHFVDLRNHLPLKRFIIDDGDLCAPTDDALLIFMLNDHHVLERVYDEIAASVPCSPQVYRDSCDPSVGLLEVYRQGCNKAAAISRLAQSIGASRVVAFGDNRNDIAMLQVADVAVAVDNAVPEVKAIAHTIIGPNTTDAVPRYIATHLYPLPISRQNFSI